MSTTATPVALTPDASPSDALRDGDDAARPPSFFRRMRRQRIAMVALAFLTIVALASLLAPWIAPYDPEALDMLNPFQPPTASHWLGTGELGKDVLSRVLYGGRTTLRGVLLSTAIYASVGMTLGLIAGYRGGWIERVVLRLADLVFSIPGIILMLVVLAIFPNSMTPAMVALGLLGAPGLALVVHAVTAGLRRQLYVRAAEMNGLGTVTVIRRHLLPGITGPVIVQLSFFGAAAVGLETGLGFLGLGGKRDISWGVLVGEASQNMGRQPWLLVPAGLLISLYTLCLGLIGDGARDAAAERYSLGRRRTPRRGRRAAAPDRTSRTDTPAVPAASATATAEPPLLSVRGLSVSFDVDGVETTGVRDVSFDVRAGQALGIVGESGCGKTVTAAAIVGLLRGTGRVSGGEVWFEGADLRRASADQLRRVRGRRIGWISQDPIASLDPSFTIGSQVAEAIRSHRSMTRSATKRRVLELLARVRLPDPERVYRSYPHQLSGGMAQRAGIAAALAADPVLVIADEPTTALDVTVQAEILDLLRSMRDDGTAVILVTHDWGVLADLCSDAVVMYAGEVVDVSPVAAAIRDPLHPYTAALLRSNPYYATPGEPLAQIDGVVPAPRDWPIGCHFQDRCPLVTAACRARPVELRPAAPGRFSRCLYPERAASVRLDGPGGAG